MLLSTLLLLCAFAQEPTPALQKAFQADDVRVRHQAAQVLAVGDERAEAWLLQEVDKGTDQRQRALLLAAALMGTPKSLAVLDEAAKKGRKPDPIRAFALLLYGSLHPDAGQEAEKDWGRCASEFERSCYLIGLLSRPQRMLVQPLPELIRKRKEEGPAAILRLSQALAASDYPKGVTDFDRAVRLLLGVDPRRAPLMMEEVDTRGDFPELWVAGRRHLPPRELKALKRLTLVGEQVSGVLALLEVEEGDRQALFDHFASRAIGEAESIWLWGTAGDLGLELPAPRQGTDLRTCQVVGILRLYRVDRNRGTTTAKAYLDLAREEFLADATMEKRWPAALLLALAGNEEDRLILQQGFADQDPIWTYRFAPLWKFSLRRFGSTQLTDHWLDSWCRDLGSGWQGYLDREGPRLMGYLLAGGTLAADNHPTLTERHESLEIVARDYALDHRLYRDLIGYLAEGGYRWMR